jgi:hypothetical protein
MLVRTRKGYPKSIYNSPEATEDEGEVKIVFTFASRGFLGPSSDPSNQDGFANAEGSSLTKRRLVN